MFRRTHRQADGIPVGQRGSAAADSPFHLTSRSIAVSGIIAALYVVLTMLLKPLAFGEMGFECRVSEAMTLLPVLFPEAIPGLTIGCLISNLFSPVGPLDIIFGTLATLVASVMSYLTRKIRLGSWKLPVVSATWPVLCNGLIIGGVLTVTEIFNSFPVAFLVVSVGEAVALIIGLLLFPAFEEVAPRLIGGGSKQESE